MDEPESGFPRTLRNHAAASQDFARKLFGHYTSGILTLLVQVGHQTGLFEAAARKGDETLVAIHVRPLVNRHGKMAAA